LRQDPVNTSAKNETNTDPLWIGHTLKSKLLKMPKTYSISNKEEDRV